MIGEAVANDLLVAVFSKFVFLECGSDRPVASIQTEPYQHLASYQECEYAEPA